MCYIARLSRNTLFLLAGVAVAALAALFAASSAQAGADKPQFLHPMDDEPIEFTFRPDQKITPAVESFFATGKNPYAADANTVAHGKTPYPGDAAAIKRGKKLYMKWCQGCHLKDGTGRIGPNLIDDDYRYPRVATEVGMFEIVYAGGAGAMQAFGKRMDQDELLKIMAFVRSMKK